MKKKLSILKFGFLDFKLEISPQFRSKHFMPAIISPLYCHDFTTLFDRSGRLEKLSAFWLNVLANGRLLLVALIQTFALKSD